MTKKQNEGVEREIGRGLQFIVYEEDRVRKVETSERQVRDFIVSHDMINPETGLEGTVNHHMRVREQIVDEWKSRDIDYGLIGNVEFTDDGYVQDRAVPLGIYANESQDPKKIIDTYIDFVFSCWKNGFSDRSFNLTGNYGMIGGGQIILMDIGEVDFDKEPVKRAIGGKKWRRSSSFTQDPNGELKEYFHTKMDEHLTLENLELYWQDNGIDTIFRRGEELRAAKEHEPAILAFMEVIDRNPTNLHAHANIGAAYRDLGMKGLAIKYFQSALDINPDHHFSQKNLALLQE